MSKGAFRLSRTIARISLLGFALAAVGCGVSNAQSCQEDFQKLSQRRMRQVEALNRLGKAGKGKMDPVAACPAARKLAAKKLAARPDATVENLLPVMRTFGSFDAAAPGDALHGAPLWDGKSEVLTEIHVYVPPGYDPAKPACVHVNQDGLQYNAPAVFDELIHKREMRSPSACL